MSIPERLYNIAKGHLDKAIERWEDIDASARQEIDAVTMSQSSSSSMSAWDRAVGKINASNAARELDPPSQQFDPRRNVTEDDVNALEQSMGRNQGRAGSYASAQQPYSAQLQQPVSVSNQTLISAYSVLGVPPNADFLTVRTAYQQLKERASPDRFPAGSQEQKAAQDIQGRIDAAFMLLTNALAPDSARFDRLEL